MMNRSKKNTWEINRKTALLLLLTVAIICIVAVLVSCGKSGEEPDTQSVADIVSEQVEEVIPVDVSLSDTDIEIGFGLTKKLNAIGGENISWHSSDNGIASVTSDGTVSGVGIGECDLTAENEFGRRAQCHVAVRKTVYITIDDGPLNYCASILNKLKNHDVKATFFVVNTYNIKLTKRMHDEGHLVALHTYSHSFGICYRSQYSYFADLEKLADIVEMYTDTRPNIIRFPGGTSNHIAKMLEMRRMVSGIDDLGYRAFDWTSSSHDSEGKELTAQQSAANVLANMSHESNIVLMHDKECTPGALDIIIPYLKSKRYIFETLDHYPEKSFLTKSWYEKSIGDEIVPCELLTLDINSCEINVGESFVLNAEMSPDKSTDYVRFVSDDPTTAKITLEGNVTGIRPGKTCVRAIASSGQEAVCNVTVW